MSFWGVNLFWWFFAVISVAGIVGILWAGHRKRRFGSKARGVEPGQGSTLHHSGGSGGTFDAFGTHSATWATSNDPQNHAKAMMPRNKK